MREWAYTKLRFFPRVTIAAVNGWCFGGAFMPLISCDLAIAADEAQFGLSEVNWGILPGGTVTRDIALALGYRDAMHYALTGDTFNGQQAQQMGLVNSSVPREELPSALSELTQKLLKHNPETLRSTKETFRHAARMDYEMATDYMAAKSAQLLLRDTENGRDKGLDSVPGHQGDQARARAVPPLIGYGPTTGWSAGYGCCGADDALVVALSGGRQQLVGLEKQRACVLSEPPGRLKRRGKPGIARREVPVGVHELDPGAERLGGIVQVVAERRHLQSEVRG